MLHQVGSTCEWCTCMRSFAALSSDSHFHFISDKLKFQSELTGEPPVFQGDILLNDRTVEYLRSQTERTAAPGAGQGGVASINGSHPLQAVYRRWKERRTRASVRSEAFKWPNATVIYRFDPNFCEWQWNSQMSCCDAYIATTRIPWRQ